MTTILATYTDDKGREVVITRSGDVITHTRTPRPSTNIDKALHLVKGIK